MKWYLCGPMTGIPQLNFPLFGAEATRLRQVGLNVVSPAEINTDPNAAWADCLRRDISALVECDGIALLDGHESSRGATLELHIARALGMRVESASRLGITEEASA